MLRDCLPAIAVVLTLAAGCSGSPCRSLLGTDEMHALTGRELRPGVEVSDPMSCQLIFIEPGDSPRVREPVLEVQISRDPDALSAWRAEARRRGFDRMEPLAGTVAGVIAVAPEDVDVVGAGVALAQQEEAVGQALYRRDSGQLTADSTASPPPQHHELLLRGSESTLRLRAHRRVVSPGDLLALVQTVSGRL